MTKNLVRAVFLALGLALVPAGGALAQTAGQHSIGGFFGVTDRNDADFTIGAEYEYHLDAMWSVGGIFEYTPDAFGGSDAAVVMGAGHYRPVPRLKLTAGLGVEFRRFNDPLRFRLGAGYDVIQAPVRVTPRIAADLGDGNNNIILGLTFFRDF